MLKALFGFQIPHRRFLALVATKNFQLLCGCPNPTESTKKNVDFTTTRDCPANCVNNFELQIANFIRFASYQCHFIETLRYTTRNVVHFKSI